MGIDFKLDRWVEIRKTYGLWWEGKLDRPIIPIILEGRDPLRVEPKTPMLTQGNCNDFTLSVEDLVDRIDYELSKEVYLGDAFPYFNLDCFGPGIVAAFLGAQLSNSTGSVWFHSEKILPIDELHFKYDSNNIWLNRIKEFCAAAMKRWQGQVLIGMPDLGGILDVLAVFRTTDNLLMDLYDEPEEVSRLCLEISNLWHRFYNEINEVLQPINPGYSDWSKIYSDKPMYIPQSDFAYMISPMMFDKFSKPDIIDTCEKIPNTIYHLDGIGNLAHLDSLLEIDNLNAVQWIPGAGQPNQGNWPEVYKKIKGAGKNIQLFDGIEALDNVIEQIGTIKGIHHAHLYLPISKEQEAMEILKKYHII